MNEWAPIPPGETREHSEHFFLTTEQLWKSSWVTPDIAVTWQSRIKPSFPEVSCDLFMIPKTPTKTGQYPHTASIPCTKAGCTEFVITAENNDLMLLPTNHREPFYQATFSSPVPVILQFCVKNQLLVAKIPGVKTDSTLTAHQCVQALQSAEKLSEMMISVLIQLKRKQSPFKGCKMIPSWGNIHQGNTEIYLKVCKINTSCD